MDPTPIYNDTEHCEVGADAPDQPEEVDKVREDRNNIPVSDYTVKLPQQTSDREVK